MGTTKKTSKLVEERNIISGIFKYYQKYLFFFSFWSNFLYSTFVCIFLLYVWIQPVNLNATISFLLTFSNCVVHYSANDKHFFMMLEYICTELGLVMWIYIRWNCMVFYSVYCKQIIFKNSTIYTDLTRKEK